MSTETTELRRSIEKIEQAARELGFDGFGIARPESPEAIEPFQEWLKRGYAGEMAYIQRGEEKRADLNRVLPGVRSVLCFRTNYSTFDKDLSFIDRPEVGDVSIYALHLDYHDVILPKLKQIETIIQNEFPGCATKPYVDTGPVLEKPLAQQAGLGWIGKHTNLLSEDRGSWFFLSEILLDVWLPASRASEDHCDTCTLCIDICPTRAIVAPYVLDARRCISYLTIELKGVIPLEFRKALGNHIYGCDDCQIVCPWNAYAVSTSEEAFRARPQDWQLVELIQWDDETFRERLRKSPIKRIKRRGLLRNVAVALGNSGCVEAVPHLIKALRDPEPLIRAHVVWALGELLGPESLAIVQETLAGEAEPIVLDEVEGLTSRLSPA